MQEPKRKSRTGLIVGIVVGVVLFAVLLCCGGLWLGKRMFDDQVKAALQENPVVTEHIGTIQEAEMDLEGTGNAEGEDAFVFRLRGSKGSGVVTAEIVTVDGDTEEVVSGTLRMDDGATYDLVPEEVTEDVSEPEEDAEDGR